MPLQGKTESLKGKIKKAMFYPAAVIIVAVLVTSIIMIFVIPQFQELFSSFGSRSAGVHPARGGHFGVDATVVVAVAVHRPGNRLRFRLHMEEIAQIPPHC